ncbi:IDEAL domain-containing protein [Metabacillus fastidiosus]|uniref:IDEAL domain-containing protein n=1 Tax=Metabacillus fastidiosus TaxID=1458 RepID=A0ABU6NS00_9BACI|nr:IDEAL domain-containing protein [Metabacillus fastidiosus]MED4399921.1 IDEAL domain-containing protein [Metabacillus fastidiosus]MED4462404.1 IDEAL domain-containing protein [Metabacillus fastidiosus]
MKKYLLNAPENNVENVMDSLLAEMVLDKALRDFRKKKIQMEIDQSLEKRNKEEFFRLTSELKEIS